ncbi:unnamed protein product [Ascophyllum nodosum]
MHHVEFSSPATLLALLLLLLSETGACTPPAVHDVGPFPSMSKFRARLAPAFAWNAPSRLLKNQRDIAGPFSTSKPQPSRPRSIFARGVQAMDVNGSDITDVEKKAALDSRQEGLWKREAGPAIDRPRIETPLDLPQPGEWLQLPLMGEPGPTAEQRPPRGGCAKADPFAVPDNDYKDSWLDSLWINLFSSRMSAAVEAEARRVVGGLAKAREAPRLVETSAASGFPTSLEGLKGGVSEGGSIAREGDTGRYTYEDYVDLATRLQKGPPERQREVVKGVLRSIFPPWFPAFYRTLFPFSKFSAQVNALMCPPLFTWLVGKSQLTDGVVDLKGVGGAGPSQQTWRSTVKVERCRYLEASKCKGTCMNLCKLPTEAFFREDLGMPLRMTPDFEDLSCEFVFGQAAVPVEDDPLMREPCWTQCLNSNKQPKVSQRPCHTMPESPLRDEQQQQQQLSGSP